MDIFEWLEREWPHRHRQQPEQQPTIAEDSMALAEIANDIKTHITSADAWLNQVLEQHVPAILAVAAKYENSPIIQALEAAALTPEAEAQIAAIINTLAKAFPVQSEQQPHEDSPAAQ